MRHKITLLLLILLFEGCAVDMNHYMRNFKEKKTYDAQDTKAPPKSEYYTTMPGSKDTKMTIDSGKFKLSRDY